MAAQSAVEEDLCKSSRKCSKHAGHKGCCNSHKVLNPFWESSIVYQLNTRKRKLLEEEHRVQEGQEELTTRELSLNERKDQLSKSKEENRNQLREKGKDIGRNSLDRFVQIDGTDGEREFILEGS